MTDLFGDEWRRWLKQTDLSISFRPGSGADETGGISDAVILVPGLGCPQEWFIGAFNGARLRDVTRVSFDFPGQGDNVTQPGPRHLWTRSMARFSGALVHLYELIEPAIGACHVVAHAMGAIPALDAWEAIPAHRRGAFIAIEGTLTGEDCAGASRRLAQGPGEVEAFIDELSTAGKAEQIWARDLGWCDPDYLSALAASLVVQCDIGWADRAWRTLDRPHYLYGERSGYPEHHRALFDATGTTVTAIADAGHFPMLDNRNDTWAAVAAAIEGA